MSILHTSSDNSGADDHSLEDVEVTSQLLFKQQCGSRIGIFTVRFGYSRARGILTADPLLYGGHPPAPPPPPIMMSRFPSHKRWSLSPNERGDISINIPGKGHCSIRYIIYRFP
jgi:hypothetical protein